MRNVEIECGKVELSLNAKKTKAMYFNVEIEKKGDSLWYENQASSGGRDRGTRFQIPGQLDTF